MTDFDPEEWLTVAEQCCRSEREEAHLRTALNRAYYAALLSTRQRIERAMGTGVVPRFGTHSAILRAVHSGGPRFERIHSALQGLRRVREAADYELRSNRLGRRWVRFQVRLSRELIRNHIKTVPDAAFRALKVPRA